MRVALTLVAVFALVAAAVASVVQRDPLGSIDAAMDRAFDETLAQARADLDGPTGPAREPQGAGAEAPSASAQGALTSLAQLFTQDDVEAAQAGRKVYYQYVDESGRVHFVERWDQVPSAFRERAGRIEMGGAKATRRSHARAAAARGAAQRPAKRPFAYTPDPEVVVYSAEWCGACRETLAYLDRKDVRYEKKDIDARPENLQELVRKSGNSMVPVVEIDGKLVRGHDPARLDRLLARAG